MLQVYIILGIILSVVIYILIDAYIVLPKRAMHWWNCLSHYGKAVLMSKLGISHIDDVKKSDIMWLYLQHVDRKKRL